MKLKLSLSLLTRQEEPTKHCLVCQSLLPQRKDGSFPAACEGLCVEILFAESEEEE